jgi:hypothetical protein
MKRVDILIAVGLFVLLLFMRGAFAVAKIIDPFIGFLDYSLAGSFGALLALFQQRAHITADTHGGDMTIKETGEADRAG